MNTLKILQKLKSKELICFKQSTTTHWNPLFLALYGLLIEGVDFSPFTWVSPAKYSDYRYCSLLHFFSISLLLGVTARSLELKSRHGLPLLLRFTVYFYVDGCNKTGLIRMLELSLSSSKRFFSCFTYVCCFWPSVLSLSNYVSNSLRVSPCLASTAFSWKSLFS